MTWGRRHACAALVAAALLCSAVGSAAAAPAAVTGEQAQTEDANPPAFVVALAEDGSAAVTVTYTFDLSDDARQAAFEELRDNETAAASVEERFGRQLGAVASDAGNATGREMSITDVDVAFETDGETGVVRLTATWEGLAATDGNSLTVTEPFASGFEPDRMFVVTVPEGYAVDSVSPDPDRRESGQLAWDAGSDLSGFEVTATEVASTDGSGESADSGDGTSADGTSDGDGDASAGESGPGFGPVVAVLAVLGAVVLATRRR